MAIVLNNVLEETGPEIRAMRDPKHPETYGLPAVETYMPRSHLQSLTMKCKLVAVG